MPASIYPCIYERQQAPDPRAQQNSTVPALAGLAEDLHDHVLDEAAGREEAPAARSARIAGVLQRPSCPGDLGLALARCLYRRRHQVLGQSAAAEIVGDLQAARSAPAERARPVERQALVADVSQLATAGDRARGSLRLIPARHEPVVQRRFGERGPREHACGHVERRRVAPRLLATPLGATPAPQSRAPQSRAPRALRPLSAPGAPLVSDAGAAGASVRRPNFSRTLVSMAAATGPCSRRKSRAFSRPWPMRSPS